MRKNIIYIGNQLAPRGGTPTGIDTLGPLLEAEGYQLSYASARTNKARRLLDMLFLVFNKRREAAYVLIDTYSTSNYWYAILVGKLCFYLKLAYIPILRGGRLPERLKKSPHSLRSFLRNAHQIVAPSRYILDTFQQAGYDHIVCIPNNISLELYEFKKRESFQPKILWVRAFAEIYNPLLALKVLKDLLKIYPTATLCMVGPEKDNSLKTCQKYAETYQLPVVFTGKLSKKAWREKAIHYDVFLNTTHYDNTPVSMIEAMALGLAVVSTRVGGIPYLVEDKSEVLLVTDGDKSAFLKAIKAIIEHPEHATAMTHRAREKIEGFDWQRVKSQWINILK